MDGTRILKYKFRLMNLVWRLTVTRQTFTFWRQMVNQLVLYQTNGNAPGRKYFTPMEAQLQRKSKARLSSYHWRGRAIRMPLIIKVLCAPLNSGVGRLRVTHVKKHND
jgi:hypothetical protein